MTLLESLARCAAQRAHVYGGEAIRLESAGLPARAAAVRRRYWREMAASEALMGRPSAEAEAMGREL